MNKTLRGITWNHPRGLDPLLATSKTFTAENPGVEIQWDARSLQDFADFPLAQLTSQYDLLVFDHPFVGAVAQSELLYPLDDLIPQTFLRDQKNNSVGPSHASYFWDDHQWALAIDAAGHVSAHRKDVLRRIGSRNPTTWDETFALAQHLRDSRSGLTMGLALAPVDSVMCFLSLTANAGHPLFTQPGTMVDRTAGQNALETLARLCELANEDSLGLNPIGLLDLMSTGDEIAFTPMIFGYVNYSSPGFRDNPVTFAPIPESRSSKYGGVLGGAGVGISKQCAEPELAAAYAMYAASPSVQSGEYVRAGGQPGYRSAWTSPAVNAATGDFFANTLTALDNAYLRPRRAGFLAAQTRAGELVHDWLSNHAASAASLMKELEELLIPAASA